MRRVLWVLLGLVVFGAAVGFATNKHYLEPQRSRSVTMSSQRSLPSTAPSAPKPSAQAPASGASAWATFDTVVNVLNVVVGIFGIWMTFHGMRMQRMAMNAQAQNRH